MSPSAKSHTPEPYVYRLKALAKVIDGDTADLDLDLGFSITLRQRIRLYGLDAPEIHSKDPAEKAKGQESMLFVSQWFQQPGEVLVRTTKEEKYGRMLADCYREGAPSLCTELLERGLAQPYLP
jgi:endonuclease YncB( thermonuclease family)